MKIVWTGPASRDLLHVFEYVATDNPKAAAELVETVIEAVERLSSFPKLGRTARLPNTRELVVPQTEYFICYRIKNQELQILSVIHGARKWPD
ncbi:MAG: uncharacterized protein JWO13_2828 [Acidobacteriales bacterium]|nr:uncharacterized protein [Terriglobales bacterium]